MESEDGLGGPTKVRGKKISGKKIKWKYIRKRYEVMREQGICGGRLGRNYYFECGGNASQRRSREGVG